jgi:hypothetical protein
MKTLMRMLLPLRIDNWFIDRAGAALIEMRLQHSPQQFTALEIEKFFQFAVIQTSSLRRTQMRFDRMELFLSR